MNRNAIYRFDEFEVDPESWRLLRNQREVHLEPTVLKLLIYLISNRDRLVSRQELLDTVWGDTVISDAALSKAVARLRKALEDDPAQPRYVETVRSLGYRFVADVQELAPNDRRAQLPERRRPVKWLATASALLVALVLLASHFSPWQPGKDGMKRPQAIAVLPLTNLTGDPEKELMTDGLQEVLITEIARTSSLDVIRRQSMLRYRNSRLSLSEIAEELGVSSLVEGSLVRDDNLIEITLRVVEGNTEQLLWAQRLEGDARYGFDMMSDAADAIAREMGAVRENPLERAAELDRIGPIDPEANKAYVQGLAQLNLFSRTGILNAVELFQAAVRIEPQFFLAWGELAAAHAMLGLHGIAPARESLEQARIAAGKALETGRGFPIGHSTTGWVQFFSRDVANACQSFESALRLDPSDPYALHGRADCLMLNGNEDESIELTRKLLLTGPFAAMHNRPLPFHLYIAGRYDEAVSAVRDVQERIPAYSMHWLLALIYRQQELQLRATEEQRRELELRNDHHLLSALDSGVAASGPAGAAPAIAEALVHRSEHMYVDPFRIAESYAAAGMPEETLNWLEQAIDNGSYEIVYLGVRPDFDALRNVEGFRELIHRISLPAPAANP